MPKSLESHLRIEGLSKCFGSFFALRDIALEVCEGEFVCLLGPSGCGKTTLLRIVAGLERQTVGRLWQRGRDISDLPPAERDFGIVFQSYALFPNLRVGENVAYGLENRKIPPAKIAARMDELLSRVGLSEQRDKFPAQLSGGQQQRVALARALAPSPALLLLDEPLSAIDAKVRQRLRREIKQLQRDFGVTAVMVTHDQEEALTMADRIAVMNHGRIEQIGGPREIYGAPASAYVADFVGAMNFFDGRVTGESAVRVGEIEFTRPAGGFPVGAEVTVAFRPEQVEWRPAGGENRNRVRCAAESVEFLGPATRVTLRADGLGGTFAAELPSALAADLTPAPGVEVEVRAPPAHLRVFPRRAS